MNKINQLVDHIALQLNTNYHNKQLACAHAWWILEAITQKTRAQLIALQTITDKQQKEIAHWIHAIVQQNMPIQYLIGHVPFGELDIAIAPPILIPRPETEWWCSILIEQLKKTNYAQPTMLDLCTGSGAIGLALAHALPHSSVWLVDDNPQAIACAQKNAHKNSITNVQFVLSDLYRALPKELTFDLITANPPYIAPQEWETLEPSVTHWEDPHALVAEHEGLAILEQIIHHAPDWLADHGQLWVEIGEQQKDAVVQLFQNAGFSNIMTLKDLAGRDRAVHAITT